MGGSDENADETNYQEYAQFDIEVAATGLKRSYDDYDYDNDDENQPLIGGKTSAADSRKNKRSSKSSSSLRKSLRRAGLTTTTSSKKGGGGLPPKPPGQRGSSSSLRLMLNNSKNKKNKSNTKSSSNLKKTTNKSSSNRKTPHSDASSSAKSVGHLLPLESEETHEEDTHEKTPLIKRSHHQTLKKKPASSLARALQESRTKSSTATAAPANAPTTTMNKDPDNKSSTPTSTVGIEQEEEDEETDPLRLIASIPFGGQQEQQQQQEAVVGSNNRSFQEEKKEEEVPYSCLADDLTGTFSNQSTEQQHPIALTIQEELKSRLAERRKGVDGGSEPPVTTKQIDTSGTTSPPHVNNNKVKASDSTVGAVAAPRAPGSPSKPAPPANKKSVGLVAGLFRSTKVEAASNATDDHDAVPTTQAAAGSSGQVPNKEKCEDKTTTQQVSGTSTTGIPNEKDTNSNSNNNSLFHEMGRVFFFTDLSDRGSKVRKEEPASEEKAKMEAAEAAKKAAEEKEEAERKEAKEREEEVRACFEAKEKARMEASAAAKAKKAAEQQRKKEEAEERARKEEEERARKETEEKAGIEAAAASKKAAEQQRKKKEAERQAKKEADAAKVKAKKEAEARAKAAKPKEPTTVGISPEQAYNQYKCGEYQRGQKQSNKKSHQDNTSKRKQNSSASTTMVPQKKKEDSRAKISLDLKGLDWKDDFLQFVKEGSEASCNQSDQPEEQSPNFKQERTQEAVDASRTTSKRIKPKSQPSSSSEPIGHWKSDFLQYIQTAKEEPSNNNIDRPKAGQRNLPPRPPNSGTGSRTNSWPNTRPNTLPVTRSYSNRKTNSSSGEASELMPNHPPDQFEYTLREHSSSSSPSEESDGSVSTSSSDRTPNPALMQLRGMLKSKPSIKKSFGMSKKFRSNSKKKLDSDSEKDNIQENKANLPSSTAPAGTNEKVENKLQAPTSTSTSAAAPAISANTATKKSSRMGKMFSFRSKSNEVDVDEYGAGQAIAPGSSKRNSGPVDVDEVGARFSFVRGRSGRSSKPVDVDEVGASQGDTKLGRNVKEAASSSKKTNRTDDSKMMDELDKEVKRWGDRDRLAPPKEGLQTKKEEEEARKRKALQERKSGGGTKQSSRNRQHGKFQQSQGCGMSLMQCNFDCNANDSGGVREKTITNAKPTGVRSQSNPYVQRYLHGIHTPADAPYVPFQKQEHKKKKRQSNKRDFSRRNKPAATAQSGPGIPLAFMGQNVQDEVQRELQRLERSGYIKPKDDKIIVCVTTGSEGNDNVKKNKNKKNLDPDAASHGSSTTASETDDEDDGIVQTEKKPVNQGTPLLLEVSLADKTCRLLTSHQSNGGNLRRFPGEVMMVSATKPQWGFPRQYSAIDGESLSDSVSADSASIKTMDVLTKECAIVTNDCVDQSMWLLRPSEIEKELELRRLLRQCKAAKRVVDRQLMVATGEFGQSCREFPQDCQDFHKDHCSTIMLVKHHEGWRNQLQHQVSRRAAATSYGATLSRSMFNH